MKKILYTIKGWFGNARFYFIVVVSFITFAFIMFTVNLWSTFDTDLPIDSTKWGQFGDFVGGILGAILSLIGVMLVTWTFKKQNATAETQRFNDLFFGLLNLYQSQIAELFSGPNEIKKGSDIYIQKCTNKDFFDSEKRNIYTKFQTQESLLDDYLVINREEAKKEYMCFYIDRPTIGACFRTIYRIYDLIDSSQMSEDNKRNYLKIIRAQLTESELFFLKYNAMTYYGEQFNNYIYKYNILKHLPLFDRLEFKYFSEKFNDLERIEMNIIFDKAIDGIKNLLIEKQTNSYNDLINNRYAINIKKTKHNSIIVGITKNNNKRKNANETIGFDKLSETQIQKLLTCFLKELFLYNGGNQYANGQLHFVDNVVQEDNMLTFTCEVCNTLNESLVLTPSFPIEKEYNKA